MPSRAKRKSVRFPRFMLFDCHEVQSPNTTSIPTAAPHAHAEIAAADSDLPHSYFGQIDSTVL